MMKQKLLAEWDVMKTPKKPDDRAHRKQRNLPISVGLDLLSGEVRHEKQ